MLELRLQFILKELSMTLHRHKTSSSCGTELEDAPLLAVDTWDEYNRKSLIQEQIKYLKKNAEALTD